MSRSCSGAYEACEESMEGLREVAREGLREATKEGLREPAADVGDDGEGLAQGDAKPFTGGLNSKSSSMWICAISEGIRACTFQTRTRRSAIVH